MTLRVAVLGAGIQGSCVALTLHQGHCRVDLFDKEPHAVSRASRWNEGKLHLGFVFANDTSFRTASTMIRGSLDFMGIVERLTGRKIPPSAISRPFNYVISRDSLVPPAALRRAYERIADLYRTAEGVSTHRYPGEIQDWVCREMGEAQRERIYDGARVEAVFETIERSVDPGVIAEHLRAALHENENIQCHYGVNVSSVKATSSGDSFFVVDDDGQRHGPYDYVVNALWEDRLRVDAQLGIHPARPWLHRYKYALHVTGMDQHLAPSSTLVLGSYGDYVCFGNGSAYLSWYPLCRTAMSSALAPSVEDEMIDASQRAEILNRTASHLAGYIPGLKHVRIDAEQATIAGGFIFAWGDADIDDLSSELHRRSDIGVRSYGRYHSVDTGKYCMAPHYAFEVARRIARHDSKNFLGLAEL